jgi:hypothetical protein
MQVMAYIHGGGLMTGSGNWEMVHNFAAHVGDGSGAVVVTMNYRYVAPAIPHVLTLHFDTDRPILQVEYLRVPGSQPAVVRARRNKRQLRHCGSTSSAAMDPSTITMRKRAFVVLPYNGCILQDNIAYVGGDPTRVTLAGQSSGGTSIFALMSSPASKGLFSGAIALSGSPNMSMPMSVAEAQNAPIIQQLQCTSGTIPQQLACLRAKSILDLSLVIPNAWNTPGMWGLELLTPQGMNFRFVPPRHRV